MSAAISVEYFTISSYTVQPEDSLTDTNSPGSDYSNFLRFKNLPLMLLEICNPFYLGLGLQ
jgi:hypothetical protein